MTSGCVYAPILKGKDGEFEAIGKLDEATKAALLPLIDIPTLDPQRRSGREGDTWSTYLFRKVQSIVGSWGACLPIMVDLFDTDPDARERGKVPLAVFFGALQGFASNFIPVTGLDRDDAQHGAVAALVRGGVPGICVRLVREDLRNRGEGYKTLPSLMSKIGASPKSSRLIIDLREVADGSVESCAEAVAWTCDDLPNSEDWLSVSVVGGRMPESLSSEIPTGSERELERTEFRLWTEIRERSPRRMPLFGDYGVVHAKGLYIDRKEKISAAPTIKYTHGDHWTVLRGVSSKKGASGMEQFRDLADRLIRRTEYDGESFSWGDRYISDCAHGRTNGPGNLQKWVAVCTNHHLTHVRRQLASITEPAG